MIIEREIIVADIGGTHARFAIARITATQKINLDRITTLKTGDYPTLKDAWAAYAATLGKDCPSEAAIAVAASVKGEQIEFTNADWKIGKSELARELSLDRHILINDFAAVGHAVAKLGDDAYTCVCGPDISRAEATNISIVGPGTGLGVAQIVRADSETRVIETEGGHIAFAPSDEFEDRLLHHLRGQHERVSVERVVSGSGLRAIYDIMIASGDTPAIELDDRELWQLALSGDNAEAAKVLGRFCGILGSVAGDIALVQGADMAILAGGLGRRLSGHLKVSQFAERFIAKGRFQGLMETIPVKQLNYPEPGLFGAAAAFMAAHQSAVP